MTAPIVPELHGSTRAEVKELGTREAMRRLLAVPSTRNYFFAALGALVMIFLFLLDEGSDLGGLFLVVLGISGIVFRWTPAPLLLLLVLSYFLWTPDGIPGDQQLSSPDIVERRRFYLEDVILVLCVLVYLIAQYRILGLVAQALSPDSAVRGESDAPIRREAALVTPHEFATMLVSAVALVVGGQLLWFFVTSVDVVPGESFPFRFRDTPLWKNQEPEGLTAGASRFYALVGVILLVMVTARATFAYCRLRLLQADEARMILLDEGWRETHRERVRVEKWRIWGRKRVNTPLNSVKQKDKNA